jgi:hypothetical protein
VSTLATFGVVTARTISPRLELATAGSMTRGARVASTIAAVRDAFDGVMNASTLIDAAVTVNEISDGGTPTSAPRLAA